MNKCDYGNWKCGRIGHDCAFCYVTTQHLCNSCENTYPECGSTNVKFGCDEDTPQRFRENRDNIFYCNKYREKEKITNADCIRTMSDEELANENVYFVSEFVAQQGLRYTGLDGRYYRTGAEVVEANKKWLQSEVEE